MSKKKKEKQFFKIIKMMHKIMPMYLPIMIFQNIIASILPFINMYLGAVIIDSIVLRRDQERLILLAWIMVTVNMALSLIRWAIDKLLIIMQRKLSEKLKMEISLKALTLDYQVLEKRATLDILEKVREGEQANGGWTLYCNILSSFVGAVITVVYDMIILSRFLCSVQKGGENGISAFVCSYWNGIVLFAALAGVLACNYHIFRKINETSYNGFENNLVLNRQFSFFNSFISCYQTGKAVRIYGMRNMILKEAEAIKTGTFTLLMNLDGKIRSLERKSYIIGICPMLLGYFLVGVKVDAGIITIGEMTLYINVLLSLIDTMMEILRGIVDLDVRNKYFVNYTEFMNIKNEKYDGTLPIEKRLDNDYDLEFRNVSFHYPNNNEMVLKNITAKIKVGGKMAIVGKNGSGKSTFIKLLCRLYDPTEGQILLNGIDIKKYDYDEYRDIFGVVFQDFHLFSFSVAQNVAANVEYDEKKVETCLRQAGMWESVKNMEHGMEEVIYKLNDDGVEISGGEAQKIAIARALYKDAPVVILDEPTAALDPAAELEIYEKFDEMVDKKTAIYISHRMSSCRFCENILVFDEGNIVEQGSHDSLLEQGGLYSELWSAQAQYYNH